MDQEDFAKGNWSNAENNLIVAEYLDMLRLELSGQPFVKSHRNEALRTLYEEIKGIN